MSEYREQAIRSVAKALNYVTTYVQRVLDGAITGDEAEVVKALVAQTERVLQLEAALKELRA